MPEQPNTPNTGKRAEGHPSGVHHHVNEQGVAVRCYHQCKHFMKFLLIAAVTETVLFWPTHKLFHVLGWL